MEKKSESITLKALARLVTDGFTKNGKHFVSLDKKVDREILSLAIMVKNGFDHVEEQLEEAGREAKALRKEMNTRFEGVDARLSNIDNRLDTFASHERRITRVEKKVGIPTVE